ncbi:MAG: 30S ribosomal protein S8 [Myxococcota bacterium]
MTMTDPIADFLTRIRNAILVKHDRVDIPASKIKRELCRILKEEGFIEDYEEIEDSPANLIRIFLRYTPEGASAILRLTRVSKPGRRVYSKAADLKPVLNGIGLAIVSTSAGLLTLEQARERGVGGELLCELW